MGLDLADQLQASLQISARLDLAMATVPCRSFRSGSPWVHPPARVMSPKLFCAILEQNSRDLRRCRAPLLGNLLDHRVRVMIDPRRNRFPGLSFCLGHSVLIWYNGDDEAGARNAPRSDNGEEFHTTWTRCHPCGTDRRRAQRASSAGCPPCSGSLPSTRSGGGCRSCA